MTLMCRSTHKDSKKSSFAVFAFFYNLLRFSKVSAIKEKQTCTEDPRLFFNTDFNKQVLMGTIYMSLRFADRPFSFFKFLREVLHVNETEEHAGARCCRSKEARRRQWGGGEGPGESCAPRGKLGLARGGLSWPSHVHRHRW